jgi:hypothetical protein
MAQRGEMPSEQRCVRPNVEELAVEVLQGEAILIHLGTGHYYTMDKAGAEIWQMIEGRRTVTEMVAMLSSRYHVSPDGVRPDVHRILDELLAERLVCDGGEPQTTLDGAAAASEPAPGAYEPPRLVKYSDMADMLALDPPLPGLKDIPWRSSGCD